MKPQNTIWLASISLTIAAFVWSSHLSLPAAEGAVDPTGTWKLITINPKTKTKDNFEHTLKLRLEGGQLTGTINGISDINGTKRFFKWPIKDTRLQANDITFAVTHPPVAGKGPDSTTTYKGIVTGDTMKGTCVLGFNGVSIKRDFEATRVKE
jgi:hypothetical protein